MRVIILLYLFLYVITATAQVQMGYVKTKGRTEKGTYVVGKRLSGVTVQVRNRNAVVSGQNGEFSFPIPSSKDFMLASVRKQGFVLVDPDVLSKQYLFSPNPLVIVMETPNHQEEDRLAAEQMIRRTLRRQLQKREDEIEELKAQNKITQLQYQAVLQQLFDEQQSNERLVRDMAERYSQIDYDQLDEFNRRVSDCILNGQLVLADSLLRTKGDLNERIENLNLHHDANKRVKEQLRQSECAERIERQDIANDCYSRYEIFRLSHQLDSAAVYIALRASLDDTNGEWQLSAGAFMQQQHQYDKAETYYRKIIGNNDGDSNNPQTLVAMNNMAILYAAMGRNDESEALYNKVLNGWRRLVADNIEDYEANLASAMNNLAALYASNPQYFEKAIALYTEAVEILRRKTALQPQRFQTELAATLTNLAAMYAENTETANEAEEMYNEAIAIFQQHANMQADLAATMNNLATQYLQQGRAEESKDCYISSLQVYCELAKDNPQAYDRYVVHTLNNIENLFQQIEPSADYYHEVERVWSLLADYNAERYEPTQAEWLNTIADYYDRIGQFEESERCYWQTLEIYKRWTQQDSVTFKPYLARTLGNISYHRLLQKNFVQAEKIAREALTTDPSKIFIQANLAAALLFQGKIKEAESIYDRYLDELRQSFLDDFKVYENRGIIPDNMRKTTEIIINKLKTK